VIASAVEDALAERGVRVEWVPITPVVIARIALRN